MVAVSTSLLVVLPTSIVGAYTYTRNKLTDPRTGVIVGVAGAAVSPFGAMLSHKLGGDLVMLGTAVILLASAYSTWRSYKKVCRDADKKCQDQGLSMESFSEVGFTKEGESDEKLSTTFSPARYALTAAVLGLVTGFFSGVFGVGGGFIIVPALTHFLGIPIKKAIGTSLIAVGILAVPGIITHATYGTIDYMLAATLALGVIPGSRVGARITFIASERRITAAFAIFLGLTGVYLAIAQLISMGIL